MNSLNQLQKPFWQQRQQPTTATTSNIYNKRYVYNNTTANVIQTVTLSIYWLYTNNIIRTDIKTFHRRLLLSSSSSTTRGIPTARSKYQQEKCGILTMICSPLGSLSLAEKSIRSSARSAMQRAWSSQGTGSPLTTMYLSPTVSTCHVTTAARHFTSLTFPRRNPRKCFT